VFEGWEGELFYNTWWFSKEDGEEKNAKSSNKKKGVHKSFHKKSY
jgi:hypothetical protein